jgi:hypothetical protein
MRMKGFIGTTLSVMVGLSAPALAQQPGPPAEDSKPGSAQPSEAPKASPPPNDVPATNDGAGSNSPPATPETPPATSPGAPSDAPAGTPAAGESIPASEPSAPSAEPSADTGKRTVIGERLSPLLATVSFGYGYAAIKYPGLVDSDLNGPFIEMAFGTELDQRLRLFLAFTSFETAIHRLNEEQWAEGKFQAKVASGLHSTKGPTEPYISGAGGVDVQRTLHVHSLGPRLDFLPLGVQGPYLGLTTALAITTGIDTRVGADLGARVGGEWRPFQEFSVGIEAGAHGQIYSDGNAAVPYAAARLNVLLDPAGLTSKGKVPVPMGPNRTLPSPTSR